MSATLGRAFVQNFLGQAPAWYKYTIVAFLLINPLVALALGPVTAGWLLLAEFIFTLAMALKCYPLHPGGLLAIEAGLSTGPYPGALLRPGRRALPRAYRLQPASRSGWSGCVVVGKRRLEPDY